MRDNIIRKPFPIKPGNSLLDKYPEIANEWHPSRNGALTPANLTAGSDKSVWWKCSQGHEWELTINCRIRLKGCKECRRLNMLHDRSIAERYPELITDWHPELNNGLMPSDVFWMSGKKVWWLCRNGHAWQATPSRRSYGTGCPDCWRPRLRKDRSFERDYPWIAQEWHPTLNENITPSDISKYSWKGVWWLCLKGHAWKQSVVNRLKRGKCPFCLIEESENSFGKHYPELIREWHTEKNGQLTPFNVTYQSNKKVWWKCVKGHEWETMVEKRNRTGCPYCSGLLTTTERSFACRAPDLARQWHPQKNGDWTIHNTACFSNRKIWWLCQCGHEWEAQAYNRMIRRKCPACRSLPGQASPLVASPPKVQVEIPRIEAVHAARMDVPPSDNNIKMSNLLIFINDIQSKSDITIQPDNEFMLTCKICGIQFPSLNWHLKSCHQMDGDAYKKLFNLPCDYLLKAKHLANK
ncbi:MAG: MucR family transcriptional regulator [Magnetococcales bacterium]|nr:MucR family transcriptional regulator [Magnetococcales bacterium]